MTKERLWVALSPQLGLGGLDSQKGQGELDLLIQEAKPRQTYLPGLVPRSALAADLTSRPALSQHKSERQCELWASAFLAHICFWVLMALPTKRKYKRAMRDEETEDVDSAQERGDERAWGYKLRYGNGTIEGPAPEIPDPERVGLRDRF